MIKKIRLALLTIAAAAALLGPALLPATALADIKSGSCAGGELDISKIDNCTVPDTGGNVNNLIKTIINIASLIVGVAAIVMIIIGGLKYITSGGDSSSISSAKNTILYALVGLVVAAMAQVLVRFILKKARP